MNRTRSFGVGYLAVGDVWVVAVSDADWSQAREIKSSNGLARSREAKKRGAVIEGELPSVEGADFSLRQCGPTPGSLPLFHQIHVHGFLW